MHLPIYQAGVHELAGEKRITPTAIICYSSYIFRNLLLARLLLYTSGVERLLMSARWCFGDKVPKTITTCDDREKDWGTVHEKDRSDNQTVQTGRN